ncbi:right-handed parallel beta-helix repeat-containing protein [Hymenobacter terrenus]|uniref:right-handed parallel beta-helix repeat-containing protein n=1 Tax=Hymenobacter terrenus TaxID=1629124 RepID=UPI001E37A691|nr:right-handed parallel beta-helix repeat-containing protein [Hymenobacter terrenus]
MRFTINLIHSKRSIVMFTPPKTPYLVAAVVLGVSCLTALSASAAQQYFLNSTSGADANPGTEAKPWKTLERANQQEFQPGDRLNFARGTRYVGSLKISQSGTETAPITVSAYGKGAAPQLSNPFFSISMGHIIEIVGNYVVVENLFLHDIPTPPPDNPPVRWQDSQQHKNVTNLAAIFVDKGASHVTVRNNEFVNAVVGVRVRGSHSLVTNNYLHDAAKITEQWGAVAVAIVGPYNEVAYNLVENYGFYGGIYVNDGAAVELDGEDAAYSAHDIHVHHNVSRNVKGGFLEIAGASQDVLIDHNVSDDVDKFVGGTNVKGVKILNNTVLRMRLPSFPKSDFFPLGTVFWTFNSKGTDEFIVSGNVFYLDGLQRLYKSEEHKLGIKPVRRQKNLYFSPNGDIPTMLGDAVGKDEIVARPEFIDEIAGDYRLTPKSLPRLINTEANPEAITYYGAFAPGKPLWKAGLIK